MIKLWIIGKRGLLARAFQRVCRAKGVDFIATSRKEVDVRDRYAVEAQFATLNVTHVVNCSGYTSLDQAESESEAAHALNVTAVELLGRLAAEHKKKMVHFSTDCIFDGEQENGYLETALPRPISLYGKTKRKGEEKLLEHCPHACIIRTSWLFGKEGVNFVTTMQQRMRSEREVRVVADQIGRPTFCDDLVEAALRLINAEGVFHFANRGKVSRYEWACAIHEALKGKEELACREVVPMMSRDLPKKGKRPRHAVLETEKYEKQMALCPRHWKQPLIECLSMDVHAQ